MERPTSMGNDSDESTESTADGDAEPSARRGVLKGLFAFGAAAIALIAPTASVIWASLDPLLRGSRRNGGDGGNGGGHSEEAGAPFVDIASLDAVPDDGKPYLFRIVADKQDAWTRRTNVPVGAVYLRRKADAPQEVLAFNSTCPHLGCFVESRDDGNYFCPCHNSLFKEDGSIEANSPSPRGLDPLETRIASNRIQVRFVNFVTGTVDRKPVI